MSPMSPMMSQGVGPVETRFFCLAEPDRPFRLQWGGSLAQARLAYETYGELNEARDNAILLFHALTGSHHAAGYNPDVPGVGEMWTEECHTGWWDAFIGPGRALDTNHVFVLCANYLGGCYGSTGPTSTCPETGRPYGATFPSVSLCDNVEAQVLLLEELGISQLRAVIGASTGGMACLSLATRYPQRVRTVIPIATGLAPTPLQRIQNFEQIHAIEHDPAFEGGHYQPGRGPKRGLALARMIAHKAFVSLKAMDNRSRLEIDEPQEERPWYRLSHPLESYMLHHGSKFIRRFDANAYLRIVEGWQRFDLLEDGSANTIPELFARCREQRYLVFTIDSDVCYYPEEQQEIVSHLKQAAVDCMWITVHSEKGHDSFLLEPHLFTPHLQYVLGE